MTQSFLVFGVIAVLLSAVSSLVWTPPVAFGILAGGLWNLANLWCLGRAFGVWLGAQSSAPTRRSLQRAIRWRSAGWFVLKFPVLYGLAIGLFLMKPDLSLPGFVLGFSVMLAAALLAHIAHLQHTLHVVPSQHGR